MDMGPVCAGLVCVLGGIFTVVAGVFHRDWYKNWLMNIPRGRRAYETLGETGVIRLHIYAGSICVIVGILMIGWFIFQMIESSI